MLARKYDNYAWEENEKVEYAKPSFSVRIEQERKVDELRAFVGKIIAVAVVVVLTYLFAVVRSGAMITFSNELVALKQQETQLINKNNELKIEVEQLKGPERIITIAEKQLGMDVARSNIYVKAGALKNSSGANALASK